MIEFKHCRDEHTGSSPEYIEALKAEARKGLKQIEEKAYIYNLKKEGYARIFKYGIAFHKKNCEVTMEIQLL